MNDFLFEGRIERAARNGRGGDPSDRCRRYRRDCSVPPTPTDRTPTRVAVAAHTGVGGGNEIAVVVIAALAVGGALAMNRPDQSAIGGPSPTHDASSSPSSEATPSASPSPTPTPLLWTHASLQEDWPAPVRPSPPEARASSRCRSPTSIPTGDTGSTPTHWVDLRGVMADTGGVDLQTRLEPEPPVVSPTERWMRIWRRHR